jgi:hypothetical protein
MCLFLTTRWERLPKFTIFGRTVWKVGYLNKSQFQSYWYQFNYEPNRVYKRKLALHSPPSTFFDNCFITHGFHSYKHQKLARLWFRFHNDPDLVIGKFRIPAFTKYYCGDATAKDRKLIASTKIKYIESSKVTDLLVDH